MTGAQCFDSIPLLQGNPVGVQEQISARLVTLGHPTGHTRELKDGTAD